MTDETNEQYDSNASEQSESQYDTTLFSVHDLDDIDILQKILLAEQNADTAADNSHDSANIDDIHDYLNPGEESIQEIIETLAMQQQLDESASTSEEQSQDTSLENFESINVLDSLVDEIALLTDTATSYIDQRVDNLIENIEKLWFELCDLWPAIEANPHIASTIVHSWNALKQSCCDNPVLAPALEQIERLPFAATQSRLFGTQPETPDTMDITAPVSNAMDISGNGMVAEHDTADKEATLIEKILAGESVNSIYERLIQDDDANNIPATEPAELSDSAFVSSAYDQPMTETTTPAYRDTKHQSILIGDASEETHDYLNLINNHESADVAPAMDNITHQYSDNSDSTFTENISGDYHENPDTEQQVPDITPELYSIMNINGEAAYEYPHQSYNHEPISETPVFENTLVTESYADTDDTVTRQIENTYNKNPLDIKRDKDVTKASHEFTNVHADRQPSLADNAPKTKPNRQQITSAEQTSHTNVWQHRKTTQYGKGFVAIAAITIITIGLIYFILNNNNNKSQQVLPDNSSNESVNKISSRIEELENSLQKLEIKFRKHSSHSNARLDTLETTVARIKNQYNPASSTETTGSNEFTGTQIDRRYDAHSYSRQDPNVDNILDSRFDKILHTIRTLETHIGAVDSRTDRLNSDLQQHIDDSRRHENQLTALAEHLTRLELTINELKSSRPATQTSRKNFIQLEQSVEDLQTQVSKLQVRFNTVPDRKILSSSQAGQRISVLQTQIERLEKKLRLIINQLQRTRLIPPDSNVNLSAQVIEDKAGTTIVLSDSNKATHTNAVDSARPYREIFHIVVKGDTLWDIAKRYVHDPFLYPELAALSNIRNPHRIYPGARIRIVQYLD